MDINIVLDTGSIVEPICGCIAFSVFVYCFFKAINGGWG